MGDDAVQVVFVRHAAAWDPHVAGADGRRPLTKAGKEQADRVAQKLSGLAVDLLLTSPMRRCLQTSAAVSVRVGCEAIVAPGLSKKTKTLRPFLKRVTRENAKVIVCVGHGETQRMLMRAHTRGVRQAVSQLRWHLPSREPQILTVTVSRATQQVTDVRAGVRIS